MKTSNMICKALFTCLILCCIALINTQVYGQYYKRGMIPVTPPVGGFAVDGDALANICPDSPAAPNNVGDWFYNPVGPGGSIFNAAGESLYPVGPGTMFIHFIDAYKSGDQTVFGSSNKIFDHPDTYLVEPGNVPPKNDMQHASAFFTYGNPTLADDSRFSFTSDDDELWCLFAADRWKTNGESYIDFEFNQNTMELVGNKIVSSAPERDGDGDLTGGRTPGDVLITIYFEGGGSRATLILDKWEKTGPGTSYNWIRKNIDTDFPENSVFCTHNIGECPAPWDIYDQADRIYSINQYAEGAINLSKVMGDGKCGTLSSVWARTKSSTSTSAELKDLAGPPFHVGLELSGPEANCPADKVVPACTSVANILSAYNTWKAGFTATPGEGVEPIVPTFSPALPTAPPANAECTGWTITTTYTLTDDCGRTDFCSSTFTVMPDLVAPVLPTLPTGGDLGCNPTLPTCVTGLVATDECDGQIVVQCVPGEITGTACNKSQTFTYTATDHCGHASSATVTYTWKQDITAPVLANLPAGGDLGCNPTPPVCSTAVTANDACDGTRTVTCTPGNITGDCVKTQTFTYTATDICGNSSTANVTYTWKVDITPPVLANVPAGGNLGCNPTPPVCSTAVTATDACDGLRTVTCTPGAITGECSKTQTFTYSATDLCGNSTTANVTYSWTSDNTPPVLSNVPAGGDLGCNPTPPTCSSAVTATDGCGGTMSVVCTPGAITGDCVKTQTFTYSAVDGCGNSVSQSATYTWKVDVTAPVLANLPTGGDLGCNPTPPTCSTAVTANDACDGTRTVTCNAGAITGDCVKTQTFTYTATDICGNSSTANVTYTWKVDTEAPVPTIQMSNMVFECNEPVIMPNVAFSDNCDGPVNFTSSIDGQPGEEYDTYSFPVGESTIHFMAIDDCQNSTEVTITVTLLPCKEEFCTYTQGFFGNQKGTACNLDERIRGDLFTAGLLGMGDLKIGCPSIGNYILFQAGDAALIRQILPGGGGIGVISGMCDASDPCLNQYLSKGTLNNALIAQTLVLGLNLRISTGLDGVPLEAGKWLTTQKKLFCEEGTGVVQKQCSDGIMVVDPYWYYMLPEKVLCYMDEEGYDMTVGGLYMLANEALGQHVDLPMMCGMTEVKLTDIAMAVDMINNAFDGCRAFVGNLSSKFVCPTSLEVALSGGLEIAYLRVYPNPFETSVTFEFISEQDADARLEIFNMLGQKVSTLMDQPVRERVLNRVEYQPEGIISEFLIYKLTLDNRVYNGKLIYKND